MDREALLKRMGELLPVADHRAETLQWAATATDDQISDWIAETELSQQFWDRYDDEIAAIKRGEDPFAKRPHDATGFDTADLDGQ